MIKDISFKLVMLEVSLDWLNVPWFTNLLIISESLTLTEGHDIN